MDERVPLIGRRAERERLERALAGARGGRGALVLLSGEAGVGKTRLAQEAAEAGAPALRGGARQADPAPYGPVVAALRAHLRARPGALDAPGPLRAHLARILPELGEPAAAGDRATLVEAVRDALARLAGAGPLVMVLDDLQWSDAATLDLLGALAEPLGELPALVIGTYRSDGLPRDHMIRRLRNDLRRGGRMEEIALAPLDPAETAELLAAALGGAPSPALARTVHDRTQGIPFFVEELARALAVRGALRAGRRGLELAGDDVPVPDTVRDAVLMAASELSPEARAAAEVAAVAGEAFDLGLVAGIAGEGAVAELADAGVLREAGPGRAAFRHALTREALYADVPWLRRRALHRGLAEGLSAAAGSARELATHWLGAGEGGPARDALLRAAGESFALHAYRDAARAGRQALELWPDGEAREDRIAALAAYAGAAELAGELAESARAWREVCALRAGDGARPDLAEAQRRLAGVPSVERLWRQPGVADGDGIWLVDAGPTPCPAPRSAG